ncbi:MAG: hypothetical protein DRQ44_12520 [Gammaproteobacteria bacterium]|nr:MAG: hypothetical protein DRQ44_12520 [Gammaproteobacteria bacterium]
MCSNRYFTSALLVLCIFMSLRLFASEWSIGVYEGVSPLDLQPASCAANPVFTSLDVLDVSAEFVADPFLLKQGNSWYLFFEFWNNVSGQGDIGYATSNNGLDWSYQGVALDEPFHLSYPYVFEWQGEHYMIPETYQADSIRLYKALNFPTDWVFVSTLVSGRRFVDPSPFYDNGSWWMYAGISQDTLYLYYADELTGPWIEHPDSPIIEGDANIARPGGRVLQYDNRLLRITQDDAPSYGNQIRAFEVTELSRDSYTEVEVLESPLLSASGNGWNQDGMHHLDAMLLPDGTWFAVADGKGYPQLSQSIVKDNWTLLYVDNEELFKEDGAAINAFDDDTGTIWHTEWSVGEPPHEVQINLGGVYNIRGFGYTPRQDGGANGRIADYEFFVSSDGVNWGLPVASGTFDNDASVKEVPFTQMSGAFVRLRALSEVNGNRWASMAELDVFAKPGDLPPLADAGGNQTVEEAHSIWLDASASSDAEGPLGYVWVQTAGPQVTLSGSDTVMASFTAPLVNSETLLGFSLTVTDSACKPASVTDSIEVTVQIADMDGDGMSDIWEQNFFGTTAVLATGDSDGDGLSNLDEFLQQLNPLDGDINSDAVLDTADILLLTRHLLGVSLLTSEQASVADLAPSGSSDGQLNTGDLVVLYVRVMGAH